MRGHDGDMFDDEGYLSDDDRWISQRAPDMEDTSPSEREIYNLQWSLRWGGIEADLLDL